jgi:Zn-finger nucleic acid-binding protein
MEPIMDCPACSEPLIVLEHDLVEVDYCAECGGIWLDAGELELLFGDARQCELCLSGGASRDGGPRRRCPRCGRRMRAELTRGDRPITFDRCPRGHGLWLDRGELGGVLEGANLENEGEVARFLREVFPPQRTE